MEAKMPKKIVKRRVKKEEIPQWQLEYLRFGKIETDPIFEKLQEVDWPENIEPTPWAALCFEIYEARPLWEKLKADGMNEDAFPFAAREFGNDTSIDRG
jgi:hypothetical protein